MKRLQTVVLAVTFFTVQLIAAPPETVSAPTLAPDTVSVIHLETAKPNVEFLAVGTPSAIKIRGKADDAKGTFKWEGKNITGNAVVNLDKFNTGIELRDKHMKERYLETQKFPESELTLTSLVLPDNATGEKFEASKLPFQGTLKLHGVTKPVTGVVDVKKTGAEAELDFDFKFPLNDFGIETPSFMGIKVTDDVQVTVALNAPLTSQ